MKTPDKDLVPPCVHTRGRVQGHVCTCMPVHRVQPECLMDAFYLENFSTSYRFPVNHLPQLCPAIYLFVMLLTLINIIYNGLYSNQNWLGLFYLFSVFFLW